MSRTIDNSNNCIFCQIISGEIPSAPVFADDEIVVLNDISPKAKVHLLILPKKHLAQVDNTDANTLGKLLAKAGELAKEKGVNQEGYRIIINNGQNAGQEISHLHLHLLAGEALGPMTGVYR